MEILVGQCWCGCQEKPDPGKDFRSGHDRVAEAAVIKIEYGGIVEFLKQHGYGPSGKNPTYEASKLT